MDEKGQAEVRRSEPEIFKSDLFAMPAPSAFAAPNAPYPALNLYPLNESFVPKHILLNQRIKIGRQTNAKTVPNERNGYFDSKVLSRQHAEVWEEGGKVSTLLLALNLWLKLFPDLHQRREKLERHVHQWRTSQSGGCRI